MDERNQKKLKLMRFWLIGIFAIIAAALVSFWFVITGSVREPMLWLALLLSAVLMLIWFFLYRWWLGRR